MPDTILFKGVGTTELFIQMECGIFLVFKRLCGDQYFIVGFAIGIFECILMV